MSNTNLLRRRLIDSISEGDNQVTYIYGPAGFGKSVLATQWSALQDKPTIWFTAFKASRAEDLFEAFITSIIEALPNLEVKLKSLKTNKKTSDLLRDIFEILDDSRVSINMIIENAELVRQSQNELARDFVQNIPSNIRLVLVTRTMPRTDFLQNFAGSKFSLIGPDELKFTFEEIELLSKEQNLELGKDQLIVLRGITEGWPAGISITLSQLEKMDKSQDLNELLKISGNEQLKIASRKILATLERNQLELLQSLCLLEEIDPEVAIKITNDNDVIRQLTLLSQNSIVITQISAPPPLFKINPIIKKTLVDEFLTSDSGKANIEKVIKTLIQSQDIRQAVQILIELGETAQLQEILNNPDLNSDISKNIYEAIISADIEKLQSWISVSEYAYGVNRALGKFLSIYCDVLQGNLDSSEAEIELLKTELAKVSPEIGANFEGDALALECIVKFARGYLSDVVQNAIKAYSIVSKQRDKEHHQFSYLQMAAYAAVIRDNEVEIAQLKEIMSSNAFKMGHLDRAENLMAVRAVMAAYEGRFLEAQNSLVTTRKKQKSSSKLSFFSDFASPIVEAMLALEAGDVAKSVEILSYNSNQAESAFNYPMAITSLGRLSYHLHLLGKDEEALDALGRARNLIVERRLAEELNDALDIWEIRLRIHLHDNERTQQLLKRAKGTYQVRSFEASTSIASAPGKALEIIETFNKEIPRQGLTYHLFKAHILKDSPKLQLDEVKRAVEIGSKHGYFNHFLTQRSDVLQQYISLAAEYPTLFHERLARAAGERLNAMMNFANPGGNTLTRREADILRHLASGLPISQIAKNLSISKNTMKTHLRHLYRKLGASDRNDAVAKGRKLLKV